jgi:hypothetical protein
VRNQEPIPFRGDGGKFFLYMRGNRIAGFRAGVGVAPMTTRVAKTVDL